MLQTKKLTKSNTVSSTNTVVELHHYKLGAINLYLDGAAIIVNTIC